MVECNKVNVKPDSQLNKLKKKLSKMQLKIDKVKILNGNNLPRKLSLTTRQKVKLRNAFENNMSNDIKLSRA